MKTAMSFATVVLTLGLAGAPALAAGHSWQVGNSSFHVYLDDLDLHSVAGRAAALGRVEQAAARLCAGIGVTSEVRACQAGIVTDAARNSLHGVLQTALTERVDAPVLAQAR